MARPPDGIARKDDTRTALFAYIAARLHDVLAGDEERELFAALGINVSPSAAGKAATLARRPQRDDPAVSDGETPLTSNRTDVSPTTRGPLRRWLLVDETRVDLDLALLRFSGHQTRQPDLVSTLSSLAGIRQVIELAGTFEVLAVAVFDGAQARRDLKALVRERSGLDPAWFDVESESWDGSLPTWRALTQRVAQAEGLAIPSTAPPKFPPMVSRS